MAQPWELESSKRPGRVRDWNDTWWAAALCVHRERALCDSPDPAELRMVLKSTGTLILHSSILVAWGLAGLPTNTTHVRPSGFSLHLQQDPGQSG